jgi:UDP-4-amino-4,6-dideoxy-N-acetyl-beta-L-altrosamine transaminase
MIPYGRQSIIAADVEAVTEVLRSDWLTQGPTVPRFESAVASKTGAGFGVAVNSATSALHIACLALGVGPGDRVWTSPNTFVASANCARYCGAEVDFVDIDARTYNMSVPALEAKLSLAQRSGTLPKVVVPVHFAGQCCDMASIRLLAKHYGFFVVEDASHAIGGEYRGRPVGNCDFSDITIFSFHPVKIITTAEGGMAMTNDAGLAQRMQRLRTHGITRAPQEMGQQDPGPWYYEQIELGFNYRMTDVQAALGLSQHARIDEFVRERAKIAGRYDVLLRELPIVLPYQDPNARSAYHLYPIQTDIDRGGVNRRELFDRLRARGIGVNVHYIPVHLQPYYRDRGFAPGYCPTAERYYANALSLPLYFGLTSEQQDEVVAALRAASKP